MLEKAFASVHHSTVSQATLSVILHNIRSRENVGAIFRTADGAGAARVYLSGYTPAPIDRFGRPDSKIAKTALGAEKVIPWEHHKTITSLIRTLKKKGVHIVASEQSPRAVPYSKWHPAFPLAVVFGNEITGIPHTLLAQCEEIIEIPMQGKKESLNVSVATGVILFHVAGKMLGDQ